MDFSLFVASLPDDLGNVQLYGYWSYDEKTRGLRKHEGKLNTTVNRHDKASRQNLSKCTPLIPVVTDACHLELARNIFVHRWALRDLHEQKQHGTPALDQLAFSLWHWRSRV